MAVRTFEGDLAHTAEKRREKRKEITIIKKESHLRRRPLPIPELYQNRKKGSRNKRTKKKYNGTAPAQC